MATAHDEVWDAGYVPLPTQSAPNPGSKKLLGVEVGVGRWATVPGAQPMYIWATGNNANQMPVVGDGRDPSANTTDRFAMARWVENTFTADVSVEICQNAPAWKSSSEPYVFSPSPGPAARIPADRASGYFFSNCYVGTRGPDQLRYGLGGTVYGWEEYRVYRLNSGVATELGRVRMPGWVQGQDWWFMTMQVWGQDPVHIRCITKAPLDYRPGSHVAPDSGYLGLQADMSSPLPGNSIYDHDPATYPDGIVINQWDYPENIPPPNPVGAQYPNYGWNWGSWAQPPSDDGAAFPGTAQFTKANPGRAWVVWEGTDNSPDQLRSGQPGVIHLPNSTYQWTKFRVRDLDDRLTARVISQSGGVTTIGGYRKAGTTITVT